MTQSIGPPSLAQGTRIAVGFSTSISRFIPAYAGNSWRLRYSCGLVPVHPRLRGELGFYGGNAMKYIGSSPLTRGTQNQSVPQCRGIRFIPAYAGNSPLPSIPLPAPAVHPRLRGELVRNVLRRRRSLGSSPLTRGTLKDHGRCRTPSRFIPAYAGNSQTRAANSMIVSVHPRLRGELL